MQHHIANCPHFVMHAQCALAQAMVSGISIYSARQLDRCNIPYEQMEPNLTICSIFTSSGRPHVYQGGAGLYNAWLMPRKPYIWWNNRSTSLNSILFSDATATSVCILAWQGLRNSRWKPCLLKYRCICTCMRPQVIISIAHCSYSRTAACHFKEVIVPY